MTRSPKVSVIMSVLNGARFLRESIESILSQTFPNFEFLIVNDGSTDSTGEIISSYADPRIRLIENSVNRGLPVSLNKCIQLSKGEYGARQDADDISLPHRLELQVAEMDANPAIGAVGGWWHSIDIKDRIVTREQAPSDNNTLLRRIINHGINPSPHGSMMIRMELLKTLEGYDERFWFTQDFDLWLRMSTHAEFSVVQSYLYELRTLPVQNGFKETCQRIYYNHAMKQYKTGEKQDFEDVREYVRRTAPKSLVNNKHQMKKYWDQLASIAGREGYWPLSTSYRIKALRSGHPVQIADSIYKLLGALTKSVVLMAQRKNEKEQIH